MEPKQNKNEENHTHQKKKKMVHCEPLGFIPGMHIHTNIIEQINVIYSIHRSEEKNHLILIDLEKNIW